MSLPNYLTLAHIRKVIAALGQRFTKIENRLDTVDAYIDKGIECATTAEIEEMCAALDMNAVVVGADDYTTGRVTSTSNS